VVCEIPRGNYGWIDEDTLDKVILLACFCLDLFRLNY
jgi:hypothetical protein